MPIHVPVRSATPDDHRHIAALLAAAFAPGPIGQWFSNDTALRAAYTRAFFDRVVSSAIVNPRALVHITEDGSAVAIWYDHRDEHIVEPVGYDTEFTPLDDDPVAARRLALLHAMLTGIHTTAAHFHLGYLAVEPSRQNRHLSDTMLRYQHPFLDLTATPAYTVAHTAIDLTVLHRHGYVINRPTRSHDGLQIWPAWRPPHPRAVPSQR
ncbi:MAG TPA: hypothetical protein VF755_22010 [Catenuloplanes sp.]|jgi:hypothetical protein